MERKIKVCQVWAQLYKQVLYLRIGRRYPTSYITVRMVRYIKCWYDTTNNSEVCLQEIISRR